MPAPFKQITIAQFASLIDRFSFSRRINAVHMHHTWRPNHSQYRGHETIVGMWRHHTEVNRWSDIAQHITIAPDGSIWLGRNWNQPPASAAGHNGSKTAGPFMFEIIGDFDRGKDSFTGAQRDTTLEVIARVQRRFNLAPETLVFHNAMSSKSCPGTAVDHAEIIAAVRAMQQALPSTQASRAVDSDRPFGDEALEEQGIVDDALQWLSRDIVDTNDPPDAEPAHEHDPQERIAAIELTDAPASRGSELSAHRLDALRPHIVNLTLGQFSDSGEYKSSAEDVDSIFAEHLPRALQEADARGEKLRLLFFAHGGLVAESDGLRIADKHIAWWQKNNIYPIYFIWETGLFQTIGQLLSRAQQRAGRALARDVWDFTTDPLIELTARALQAPRIWNGMKTSADLASQEGGGARYVAEKLNDFCAQHADKVELHAAGHSAGSIFHGHFLSTARRLGVPSFASAHFLAPAVRSDEFKRLLGGFIGAGNGVDHLTLYTMRKDFERDDHCNHIYRKSLLYLIYHALEKDTETPILGLEESLRKDAELKRMFGLGDAPSTTGEVVWSVSATRVGRSASASTSHGGFDDDAPTMNSMARRILNKPDAASIVDYSVARGVLRSRDNWLDAVDWPEGLTLPAAGTASAPLSPPAITFPAPVPTVLPAHKGSGRRLALCIGIDSYPTAPLAGCVNDARSWAATLGGLGFEPPMLLLNEAANRQAILQQMRTLVSSAVAGDMIVFQFSGHGTQVPDLTADEAAGDTPEQDEAICPIDFAAGALIIDDDIADICANIGAGVNMTCFIDCCHSGTISRFAVGAPTLGGAHLAGRRARFVTASPALIAAHQRFRSTHAGSRNAGSGGLSEMKEIVYSACLSSEVAWENNGHGDFTVQATRLLARGVAGVSHEQFEKQLIEAFGAAARQHPRLYCAAPARTWPLLQALTAPAMPVNALSASTTPPMSDFFSRLQALIQQYQKP